MTAPSPQYNSAAGHTPQYTPTHHNEDSIMSPASVPPAAMTPAPPVGMKSPMYQPQQPQAQQQTNDLRKIRRPSKPKGEPPSPQPPPQVKEEIKPDPEPFVPAVKKEEPEPEVKKEEPKFEARWEELPEKVLQRVFGFCVANESANTFLLKAAQVSTKWRDATSDPKLWTHLDLSVSFLKEKHRNDKKVEFLLKKYKHCVELKLNGWKNAVSTSTLKIIAANCPGLVSLGLSGCFKLSNEDMKLIGDSFGSLKRIDLSNVSASSCSSRAATSSTCLSEFVAIVGKRLTHFNISNNKMAGLPFVFKAIAVSRRTYIRKMQLTSSCMPQTYLPGTRFISSINSNQNKNAGTNTKRCSAKWQEVSFLFT